MKLEEFLRDFVFDDIVSRIDHECFGDTCNTNLVFYYGDLDTPIHINFKELIKLAKQTITDRSQKAINASKLVISQNDVYPPRYSTEILNLALFEGYIQFNDYVLKYKWTELGLNKLDELFEAK